MPRLSKIGAAALAAFGWTSGVSAITASYLQVAGGGGGGFIAGGNRGAGGGAGGFLTGSFSLNPTQSYTVVVGAGGTPLANGSNSTITGTGISVTASVGGGAGGSQNGASSVVGQNGGSGGGGPSQSGTGSTAGGTGTVGQGNDGAAGTNSGGQPFGCGGGGGAGAAGSLSNNPAGAGGIGLTSSISGTSTYYAGGGGGGTYAAGGGVGGAGGLGGGGLGGGTTSANGVSGTANTGGGGGGAEYSSSAGASGGSGVVIISYAGAQQFGGGVVTSSGGNTIHTFTTSGTLSPLSSLTASYLIVAGGGGGGGAQGGGGGAGGLLSGSGLTIDTNSIYAITVGAGGTGGTQVDSNNGQRGTSGSNSAFSMVSTTAIGGGGGGAFSFTGSGIENGLSGGSGGGAGLRNGSSTGGAGTTSQGFAGGNSGTYSAPFSGAGGGGASEVGDNGGNVVANGGDGLANSITGTSTYYAGGGGGGNGGGAGGSGGGGAGSAAGSGTAGTANTGGGGGGAAYAGSAPFYTGGAGGSGIVIISYPGSTQQMAGGTVTVAGGNVIHTFTSSGFLTPIVLTTNSLRFRSSASAYLNRTPSVASNQKTFTISFWSKLGQLGTYRSFFSAGTANPPFVDIGLQNTDEFQVDMSVSAGRVSPKTTAVFRDPSAWYHFVVAFDTTQATQANRVKVYVNGVQQTITATGVAQNTDLAVNSVVAHNIGRRAVASDSYLDGYMADINFVDGQALTPNSFGTSNGLGVWQPIRYGGSYGTNGFYLPFTNSGPSVSADYLVVAGGGGGGAGTSGVIEGGGGGAGGFRTGSGLTLNKNSSYSVTVGSGGASNTNGSDSVLSTITSTGGGAGGRNGTTSGSTGGSGGGAGGVTVSGANGNTPSTSPSQGNNGGAGVGVSVFASGGGGGAGAVGGTAVSAPGAGGAGTASSISGSSITYAGGGGGTQGGTTSGAGGAGGGGAGATSGAGNAGTANLGGGGGAGSSVGSGAGGAGGSGIVIISYAGTPQFTGGTITQSGGNTIHTFTSSGTLSFNIASDYSPNGNNWTANNISLTAGSTYDSMTDVPTLTSATAANYCVINPINQSGQTITNGNLTTQWSATAAGNRSSFAMDSGKWYWEVTMTSVANQINTGIVRTDSSLTVDLVVAGSNAIIYIGLNGNRYINGSGAGYGASYVSGDIIGVAVDITNNTIAFYKNGVSQGTITGLSLSGFSWYAATGNANNQANQIVDYNFGQQPFAYTPPTDFLRLNTFNLPTPTIGATASTTANKYMDASLWTGNGASSQVVTNSGSMQPDFVWIKSRNQAFGHLLFDSVRGISLYLQSNGTGAEVTDANMVSSLNSNGFTVGSSGFTNGNTYTQVGWQWRASNATAVTNTNGSIISTVSANTTAGFSIVTYTGNGTAGATVGHGLGVAPSMYIVKVRSTTESWITYHISIGATNFVALNLVQASTAATAAWNNTAPTSTVFSLGNASSTNGSGATFVAYCFAPVAGYSAFGSYTGNGSTDGTFVYLGFRPRFMLVKRTDAVTDWQIIDSARNTYNAAGTFLYPNLSNAEDVTDRIDFVSNGFKLRTTAGPNNASSTWIYACFAENPFKYANAR